MKNQDYQKTFTTETNAKKAFENIVNVGGWWTNSFKGSAKNVNDEFSVNFGATWVKFKVVESIPYKKLTWLVTSCHLDWIKNKTEWDGTKIVWNISEENNKTKVEMTHVGLIPGVECYSNCESGWNQYTGESLPQLIATGKGTISEESKR